MIASALLWRQRAILCERLVTFLQRGVVSSDLEAMLEHNKQELQRAGEVV